MYWSNYHSHCIFCDGRSSMETFVKFAISRGIRKYGFSSHAPLPFHTRWTMPADDFPDYQSEFNRLKLKYQNELDLYFGLEVDYIDNFSEVQNVFIQYKTFDYLIGSIHYLGKISANCFWTIDGDVFEFNKGLMYLFGGDINAAVKRYYEVSSMMIEKGGFDIVGHFDKISMNASHYKDFDMSVKWYQNLVGETLQLVKDKGLILEINTKSLTEKGITYPNQDFYPIINDLQIPITVNSDCHYPTTVTDGFEKTYKALKNAGFKGMQQLIDGKWQAVEFNEKGLLG